MLIEIKHWNGRTLHTIEAGAKPSDEHLSLLYILGAVRVNAELIAERKPTTDSEARSCLNAQRILELLEDAEEQANILMLEGSVKEKA